MAAAPAAALAHCTHVLLFAHAHTGRTHVPKHMLRAASVRRVPGGFGPRVFACAESRPCLCLAVSGMDADCSCGAYWRRVREAFCKNLLNGLGVLTPKPSLAAPQKYDMLTHTNGRSNAVH